ncbi:MAG: ATP-binding SpoIIE family protein phosphatase [Verrucomicrobiia bacterium]
MLRAVDLPLTDRTQVGSARRIALDMARKAGFDQTAEARVGLVVTEAASNALRHGENARLVLRFLTERVGGGIEVLVLDSGRGMPDVNRCLEDGFSTAGTPGTGLGAIRRLSDVFDVYSRADLGTVVLARLWPSGAEGGIPRMELGCVCVPKAGEHDCGDVWTFQFRTDSDLFMLADGLGHGPLAARAAHEAARVFEVDTVRHPQEILEALHSPLRATRGASVAVAEICHPQNTVRYAGVGNISGRVLGENSSRSLVSFDGTLGHELHRVQEFHYPWPPEGLLVLHSDGLATRWDLAAYPGLAVRHPGLIAGVLYRDFRRDRDDVTVLVARERR